MIDSRSAVPQANLGALLEVSTSAANVVDKGAAQYSTPPAWARHFASLIPPVSGGHLPQVIDWQCAGGNLLADFPLLTKRHGVEIDGRFNAQPSAFPLQRINASCTRIWALLYELFPAVRFDAQVVNPPFGLKWKGAVPNEPDRWSGDSVAATWEAVQHFASESGCGYFLAGRKQIEALGIHRHPWAYLYQAFPTGMFPGVALEIGVVHWARANPLPSGGRVSLEYRSLSDPEHAGELAGLRRKLRPMQPQHSIVRAQLIHAALATCELILTEERQARPPFHVYVRGGVLRLNLGTREQLRRKLTRSDVLRLARVDGCHPMTLVHEVDTRKLLRELLGAGFTIEPAAQTLMTDALRAGETMAVPLRPVTDFERGAYVDEMDCLCVRADFISPLNPHRQPVFRFIPGRSYPLSSGTYCFVEKFARDKLHTFEDQEGTRVVNHEMELAGVDRYVAVTDEVGTVHRFMDRPTITPPTPNTRNRPMLMEHPERLLFEIFNAPPILTVQDVAPEAVAANRTRLLQLQSTIAA